ncbi:cysteine peptidase family C39 domain-containing protein [Fibrella aquatilis]|uniref:Thioredoxin domain-containing protein n=1 Tax=Fibrella aquatilis TaxID=2817059 RepID=A0A939K1T9_9BACT|nr:cysteine peptidase family C39 domain-containing protein [Fibrella aquatilis]MBO0932605.1 thioredoxin domain-containing protein [Fibrella aquatilis]
MAFLTFTPDLSTDNAAATLQALLHALRVRVTEQTIRSTLLSHPDYPSMLSLSDTLAEWQVDRMAVQLNAAEQLRELPLPFVAHLTKQGGWYVLVTALHSDHITYTDAELGSQTEALADFEAQWSGVVLVAEANEQAGESDYTNKRKHEWLQKARGPAVIVGIALFLAVVFLGAGPTLTLTDYLWLFTKATGLFISILLVSKVMGNTNTLADQLCRLTSQTNCNSILNAPAAKLWGWLSWADVGLLYFAGGLLAALAVGFAPTAQPVLGMLALLALPYTLFSLYYQGVVMRQWCTLCLLVQAVLLAEGVLAATHFIAPPDSWQPYALVVGLLLMPTLVWMVLKPLLISHKQGQQYHEQLIKLRRDPDLFRALMRQQAPMPPITPDMHPVWLGNPDAAHTITMVTNPYCGPCARKHKELEALLTKTEDVNVQVVFTCDGPAGRKTQVALHLMALPQNGSAQAALADWYGGEEPDYAHWATAYPLAETAPDAERIAYANQKWSAQANIDATPTLYIDGYPLPQQYALPDALRMIRYVAVTQSQTA